METTNLFLSITPSPVLSVIIWFLMAIVVMYLARHPFHRCMASLGLLIYHALRLGSFSLKLADKRLQTRNREVLLSSGLENEDKEAMELGGVVTLDAAMDPQDVQATGMEIGDVELSAVVNLSNGLVAAITIKADNNLQNLFVDAAIVE